MLMTGHGVTGCSISTCKGDNSEPASNPEHPMSEPDLTSPRCEAPYTNCRLPGEQYEVEYVTEEGMGNKRVSLCLEHAKKAGATSGLRKVE